MPEAVLDTIAAWDGRAVVVRHDAITDTWIFIALHDDTLGRPTGGTRMKRYPALADAVRDAQRLAAGMTDKWAGLDLPYGGGKAVLAIPGPLAPAARDGLLRRYGALLATLGGTFSTGADLGTSAEDMAVIADCAPWVLGIDDRGRSIDPGPFTARGVRLGMEAALARRFGAGAVAGRTVLVEGVGGVGGPLARGLAADGARLLLADLDTTRAETLAAELGGRAVALDRVIGTECDVYAPCAVGATLRAETIARLRCAVVAGSANNQLLEDEDADRLHARSILYVPDYVINAGGAMAFALLKDGLSDLEVLMARMAGVGTAVSEILEAAAEAGESPPAAARRIVARRLAATRARAVADGG